MYPNCNNLFRGGEKQGFKSGYTFCGFVSLSLGEASRAPGYTHVTAAMRNRTAKAARNRAEARTHFGKSVAEIDRMITYRINWKR